MVDSEQTIYYSETIILRIPERADLETAGFKGQLSPEGSGFIQTHQISLNLNPGEWDVRAKRWVLLGEGRASMEFEQTVSRIQTIVTSIVKKTEQRLQILFSIHLYMLH